MQFDDVPGWLPGWCLDHLGAEPAGVLFGLEQISTVFGLWLASGVDVVVKARGDNGRAGSCVAAQAQLAGRGFPCARPLTPVVGVGSLAVHGEEFRPGGDILHGETPDVAVRYAEVYARLTAALADVDVAPPRERLERPADSPADDVAARPGGRHAAGTPVRGDNRTRRDRRHGSRAEHQ